MQQLSLDTQGTKPDLVERLHEYLSTQQVSKLIPHMAVSCPGQPGSDCHCKTLDFPSLGALRLHVHKLL